MFSETCSSLSIVAIVYWILSWSEAVGALVCSSRLFSLSLIPLVEKIIIDQVSLKKVFDDLCPGAYSSLTKVDFKALDLLQVKPIGVYGSRERIVYLLSSIDVVDFETLGQSVS